MFFKMGALKIFKNFTGKHLCWSLFLVNFIKNRLRHRFFPVKFAKFLWTPFHRTLLLWLLIYSARTLSILAMRTFILTLEDSIWLQLIYFLNIISFWLLECLFPIDGTLMLAIYFIVLQNFLCVFFPLKSAIMENSRHCIN